MKRNTGSKDRSTTLDAVSSMQSKVVELKEQVAEKRLNYENQLAQHAEFRAVINRQRLENPLSDSKQEQLDALSRYYRKQLRKVINFCHQQQQLLNNDSGPFDQERFEKLAEYIRKLECEFPGLRYQMDKVVKEHQVEIGLREDVKHRRYRSALSKVGWQVKQHFKHNWHRYLGAVTTLAIISGIVAACVLFPPLGAGVVIGFTSTGVMAVLSSVVCLCALAVTIMAGCGVSLGLSSFNHFQQDSLAPGLQGDETKVKSSYSKVSPRLTADKELSSDDDDDEEDDEEDDKEHVHRDPVESESFYAHAPSSLSPA